MKFKINVGYTTEDEVQGLVEHAFSPDFVFRAPRREDGKEVTDVLVPWDDTALVIQAKSQAIASDGSFDENPLKWGQKNLRKAGRQVSGAVRAMQAGRMSHIENHRQGRVPFSAAEFKWLYGLIVMHHSSAAYDPFELVPELRQTKVPLHVLSFRDFLNLASFLDTPADLLNYLECRSVVLLPTLRPRLHEEEAVFQYYLENMEQVAVLHASRQGVRFTEEDAQPYADQMRRLFSGRLPEADQGYVIDEMIDRCHEQDDSLEPVQAGGRIVGSSRESYVKIATELGKIPRVRRIALGRRYLRAIRLAEERQIDEWKATWSHSRGDCMLFLASPLPLAQRSLRRERLLLMTEMPKHYRQAKRAIGIATEAGHASGRSYDFLYLDYEPTENEEALQIAKELLGGEGERHLTEDPH